MSGERQPVPFDYGDPDFRLGTEPNALDHSILRDEYRDIHPYVADRLAAWKQTPVLDLGCGPTRLGRLLSDRGVPWVGLDRARERLAAGRGPRLLGDALRLPFAEGSFGAVAALYMLYHFADPAAVLRESQRVLRAGGVFVCAAPAADDDPEIAPFLPQAPAATFDSDVAPAMLGELFADIGVQRWEMALYRLPDERAVWTYLVARGHAPEAAERAARATELPLWLTKRGAIAWGWKR